MFDLFKQPSDDSGRHGSVSDVPNGCWLGASHEHGALVQFCARRCGVLPTLRKRLRLVGHGTGGGLRRGSSVGSASRWTANGPSAIDDPVGSVGRRGSRDVGAARRRDEQATGRGGTLRGQRPMGCGGGVRNGGAVRVPNLRRRHGRRHIRRARSVRGVRCDAAHGDGHGRRGTFPRGSPVDQRCHANGRFALGMGHGSRRSPRCGGGALGIA